MRGMSEKFLFLAPVSFTIITLQMLSTSSGSICKHKKWQDETFGVLFVVKLIMKHLWLIMIHSKFLKTISYPGISLRGLSSFSIKHILMMSGIAVKIKS